MTAIQLTCLFFNLCLADVAIGSNYLRPAVNRACQPTQPNVAVEDNPNEYLTCTPIKENLNFWRKRRCASDTTFLARNQKCISKRAARRQESLCRAQPNSFPCSNKCSVPSETPQTLPGAPCVWTEAPLEPYSANPALFLQCNPTSLGSVCGAWNQMQCANNTVFNLFVQVCVSISMSQGSSCPVGEIAMFNCGPNNWCPDGSMCRDNVCCQAVVPLPSQTNIPAQPTFYPPPAPTLVPAPIYPQPTQPPQPPSNQRPYYPTGPPGYGQQPQIPGQPYNIQYPSGIIIPPTNQGGYPSQVHPQPGYPNPAGQVYPAYPQPGGQQNQGYPGYLQPPTMTRYPGQQPAYPGQQPAYPGQQPAYPGQQPAYPGQQPAYPGQQPAYPGQQPNYPGYQQPMYPQPFTQPSVTLNPATTIAQPTPYMPPRYLPVCADNQPAKSFCKQNFECPDYHGCTPAGACCPLPSCATGAVAVGFCEESRNCATNQFCFNGGCCVVPTCPNGETASRTCDAKNPCIAPLSCLSGACCSTLLPDCPNGQVAAMPCTGPGTCPDRFYCHTDKTGSKQGCCEIPVCPDGQTSVQPCNDDQLCPVGLQCIDNACCRPQLTTAANASTGIPPSLPETYLYPWLTSSYATTPVPYYQLQPTTPVPYYQLQPTTVIPVGPQNPFPRTSSCNSCCPRYQLALCICSQVQNLCPQQTSCNQGACCAARDAVPRYANKLRPGDRCRSTDECPDSDTGMSACSNGHCICQPHAISNGFTCAPINQYYKLTPQGDKSYRRRIIRSIDNDQNIDQSITAVNDTNESSNEFENQDDQNMLDLDQFVYWRTFVISHCVTDRECIPEMVCINGTCQDAIKTLNSENCLSNEHCTRLILNSFCATNENAHSNSVQISSHEKMCQCEPGFYEFKHKCWKKCPDFTSRLNNKCILTHDIKIIRKFFPTFGRPKLEKSANSTQN